jgi:hypothetical protein
METIAMGSLESKFIEVCDSWLQENEGYSVRGELGVFSFAMVVWLGVQQRLKNNSLKESINSLVERAKLGGLDFLVNRSGVKLRTAEISSNTGGISRARERHSLASYRELFYSATEAIFKRPSLQSKQRNIYVIDGQVVAIARSDSNLEYFCPTGNGEGELHFPRMRVVSAHEVRSGIAREVSIGNWKQSEVALSREVASRLPRGSLLIMDRGFAKPSFLEAADAEGIKVLARMKEGHAKKLLGETSKPCDEKKVEWIAKLQDQRTVTLTGRIIKHTSSTKGFRSSEFYFFTTDMTLPAEDLAELYRQRVHVEVFIRDVKQTLRMAFIRSRKGKNVEKEILVAFLTFNLLRAIMEESAEASGLPVERMSFSGTVSLVKSYAAPFAKAKGPTERAKLVRDFHKNMEQSKLPLRNKERYYPRVIKFPRDKYDNAGTVKKNLALRR